MPDRPVLAGGVERLEHHQHTVGVLRGKARLVLGEQLHAEAQLLLAFVLLQPPCLEGRVIVLGEHDLRAWRDAQWIDQLRQLCGVRIGLAALSPRHPVRVPAGCGPR